MGNEISLSELKTIIQGLKMSGLGFVEEDAIDNISFMIKKLPSAEELDKLAVTPKALSQITKEIGVIMQTIDNYSKQTPEYNARFQSKKKLPPRYKIIKEKELNMNTANTEIIRKFIKLSSKFDNKGKEIIASKLLSCARQIQDGTIKKEDLNDVGELMLIAGYKNDAQLVKEAGFFGTLFDGVKNTLKTTYQNGYVPQMAKGLQKIITDFDKNRNTGVLIDGINNLMQWEDKIKNMLSPNEKKAAEKYMNYITKLKQDINTLNNELNNEVDNFTKNMQNAINELQNSPEAQAAENGENQNSENTKNSTETVENSQLFTPGAKVTWTTNTGHQIEGTIDGPSKQPGETIVNMDNGQPVSISNSKLSPVASNIKTIKTAKSNVWNNLIIRQLV